MKSYFKKYATGVTFTAMTAVFFSGAFFAESAGISPTINASELVSHVEVFPLFRSGSFVEGSTFDVPIVINTKGASINGVEVHVSFDKDKLSIISQSNGTSIIGIWVEPPRYSNSKGTASYVGVIPNGITTDSGIIGNITFKALATGQANVMIDSSSRILLNDGLGTNTILETGRALYSILSKAPEGVRIYSETHPFQGRWYNNNNPIVLWDRDSGVDAFSYVLDNKPGTILENKVTSIETSASFTDLRDGLWYFHIKSSDAGIWGTPNQFLMRIDTNPPADFKPEVNYLVTTVAPAQKILISFFTTDDLSGIDHYEVGVINKTQASTESPVFVRSESPFQISLVENEKLQVIVRVVDKAGNMRDVRVSINPPMFNGKILEGYLLYLLWFLIFVIVILTTLLIHYLFGHHLLKRWRRAIIIVEKEEKEEEDTARNETKENMIEGNER